MRVYSSLLSARHTVMSSGFLLAGVECRPLHKDPPPVLRRSRAQSAAGRTNAAEAAPVGDGDAAAARFGPAVELLLDHLVEKPARKG